MKLTLSGLIAVALFAATIGQAKIERTVDKSFPVGGKGSIQLETNGGGISVVVGTDSVVRIVAHERIRAGSEEEADRILKDLTLTFEQNGNDVRARAAYDRPSLGFHFGSWPPVQVDFVATVPVGYAAEVRTSGGNITIGDLGGAVAARTSGGSIKLGRIGGRVEARTSGGNVGLEEARDEVKLSTSGGSITVGRVSAPADVSTSGGNITLDAVEQSLRAHTSGGSIRAAIAGPLKSDCVLSTSGGNVRVTVAPTAAFHLDASASGGSVNAEGLTITLKNSGRSRTSLVGDVNGGGPELKLRTSGGSIGVAVK